MREATADYEGQNLPLDPPGTPPIAAPRPNPELPARGGFAMPKNKALSVRVKRVVWTESPKGTWEIEAGIEAEPDDKATTRANLDRMHATVKARLTEWIETVLQEDAAGQTDQ